MPPKFLRPVAGDLNLPASNIIALPIGGAGFFPLGLARTFNDQFAGNRHVCLVISLAELLYAAAVELRIPVVMIALPEWRLFVDGRFVLDTPESTTNFMLYYLMVLVFPNEDKEILFGAVVARLMEENAAIHEKPVVAEEPNPADFKRPRAPVIDTPRVKVVRGLPSEIATQLQISDLPILKEAIQSCGMPVLDLPEEEQRPTEIWQLLSNCLGLDQVMKNLLIIHGLCYPPWVNLIKHRMSGNFFLPEQITKYDLVSLVPHHFGKDQLSQFMLPGLKNLARPELDLSFDVPMIGGDGGDTYVASETRGFSFRDPSKLLSPLPRTVGSIFRRLLRLAPDSNQWAQVYKYCHKYLRLLFSNPYVAGFPSVYRDLFTAIAGLEDKARSDVLMTDFYRPRSVRPDTSIVTHIISQIVALLHSAGMRDNHIVVAVVYMTTTGSCRFVGGDSEITAFTGTAGKGKSMMLKYVSWLTAETLQYIMDAASARAQTIPLNPITIAGRLVGEAPHNGRIMFMDEGAKALSTTKGSRADSDGDAMRKTAATKGALFYQVSTPVEDARGVKTMTVQTRAVQCQGQRLLSSNGQDGDEAADSRTTPFYIKNSTLAPAQTASAICALDVFNPSLEHESMFAANQLRHAKVAFYNAYIAFGLADDPSVVLWLLTILHGLDSPIGKDFPQELKILQSARKINKVIRCSLSITNFAQFHLLDTLGFGEAFIGNDMLKRLMFMQESSHVTSEIIALALSSAMPVCNGNANMEDALLRQIKNLIDFEAVTPFAPKTVIMSGIRYYVLKAPNDKVLEQTVFDRMPEYERIDVKKIYDAICKTSVGPKIQGMNVLQHDSKEGRPLFYAEPLDKVLASVEINVLNIIRTRIGKIRADFPNQHDVFPHDSKDIYLVIGPDFTNMFTRHSNDPLISVLGNEFDMGMSLLEANISSGNRAIRTCASVYMHPRDQIIPPHCSNHFSKSSVLHGCTTIDLKILQPSLATLSTGFLQLIPCFRDQTCMIATGKDTAPDEPETVKLRALTAPIKVANPLCNTKHVSNLPAFSTTGVEAAFFGTSFSHIEIPPGEITELYLVYTRTFQLCRKAPMQISRPDFIAHFLAKTGKPYQPYLPEPYSVPNTDPNTTTIYELFQDLAQRMSVAGIDDEIIRHLLARKRKNSIYHEE